MLGKQPDRGVGRRGLTSAFATEPASGSRAQRRRSTRWLRRRTLYPWAMPRVSASAPAQPDLGAEARAAAAAAPTMQKRVNIARQLVLAIAGVAQASSGRALLGGSGLRRAPTVVIAWSPEALAARKPASPPKRASALTAASTCGSGHLNAQRDVGEGAAGARLHGSGGCGFRFGM